MEIERKYIVSNALWQEHHNPANATLIRQAYLTTDPKCTVRIRLTENRAVMAIKGASKGNSRPEYEYEIPYEDGASIIELARTPVILKWRYRVEFSGYTWEVDEFLGDNEGLILAEVELQSEEEKPEWPAWVLKEVSGDPRYFNLRLAINPIINW